jgi:hypothetical protein
MSNNFTAEQIAWITIFAGFGGLWVYGLITSAKAKAFNEGYKRGRATKLAMDKLQEIK